MPDQHAKYPPSSSYLWLNCPMSTMITSKLPEGKSGAAAEIGTRLHNLMEEFLKKHTLKYFDPSGKNTFDKFYKNANTLQHKLKMDDLSRDKVALNLYENMQSLFKQVMKTTTKKNSTIEVTYEQKVQMPFIIKDCWGTGDLAIVTPSTLFIVDYKFGRVPVSPQSPQLNLYAMGKYVNDIEPNIDDYPQLKQICNVIVQPKLGKKPSYHMYTLTELYRLMREYRKKAKRNENKIRPAIIGEHCEHYAKCRPYCKKYKMETRKKAQDEFKKAGY